MTDQERQQLDHMGVSYTNCVNAVDFQNEQLGYLLKQLQGLRVGGRAKRVEIEHIKLDIGDRKNKRYHKEKERQGLLPQLATTIAQVKMRRLEQRAIESAQQPACERMSGQVRSPAEVHVSSATRRKGSAKVPPQRWITDEEISAELRKASEHLD
mmetsp:Transcript_47771/g.119497  ORF Transcript_47771/g.119497 Transcript_47771/m.119497 type:complete len:155 (-) Transcript_47771:1377-1841(-)